MTGAWNRITRLTGSVVGQARSVRDKARELREEFRGTDEPERLLVAPLVPGQQVRYVSQFGFYSDEYHKMGAQFADQVGDALADSFDPRVLFGLLNIVNPVAWVDAVITPVRIAAGVLTLPAKAVVAGGTDAGRVRDGQLVPPRRPLPLTGEQEAFRALFGFDAYEPLADQLAEFTYHYRYAFSGDLTSLAGGMLLFLARFTDTPVAVTDTHLHVLELPERPAPGQPDGRRPRLLWSVERRRLARIDFDYGPTRLLQFPATIVFDDGSWIHVVNPTTRDDQNRFLQALEGVPGKRPAGR
ncbi:hypothetical protein [Micromonospora halophytica]|uniref:Uncharacterized protein n=1 Tax=Micromonospora halophytica TaxID=47864 RepID=A0A1C5HX33_9ACTN|nr:hypothetical protein [Micromonospora halophytica]SCG50584.1 hypothetical protein GA0070560_106196 [Micromonospora halophytica]